MATRKASTSDPIPLKGKHRKPPKPPPPPPPPPPPSDCDVIVPDPSAIANDDFATIMQAFADTPTGGVCCFPDLKRYRCEDQLDLIDRHITVYGNGSTGFVTSYGPLDPGNPPISHRRQLVLTRCIDTLVKDLFFEGINESGQYNFLYEQEYAFFIVGGENVTLDSVGSKKTGGDGFSIMGDKPNNLPAKTIRVTHGDFDYVGRQGMTIGGAVDGLIVDYNKWDHVARSIWDLELVGAYLIHNALFDHNIIGSYGNYALAAGGGGTHDGVTVQYTDAQGLFLVKVGNDTRPVRFNYKLLHNVAQAVYSGGNVGSAPLQFKAVQGVLLDDNTIPLGAGRGLMSLVPVTTPPTPPGIPSCDVTAQNNHAPGGAFIWPSPGLPGPAGCLWTDGGGNTL